MFTWNLVVPGRPARPDGIIWTLGGFLVLMLAYFGSKAVLELILQR